MKQKSLTKNALYNFLYTGLNLFFPLITSPYVSRVLGAENLGKFQFANSIVQWFLLFAVFGTTQYGVREVAKNRDDSGLLNRKFSEIVILNSLFSLIATVVYFFMIFNVRQFNSEIILYFVMSLSIVLNMFNIDWFYQGIEEYRYITIRSTIFKVISLVSIFLFIHSENHYIIYALITVLSTSLSGILNYIYSRNFVKLTFTNIHPFKHIKSLSIFFSSTLIVNSYSNLDKTLLGFMVNSSAVAYMAKGTTITNMGVSIAKSITNVTLPRASFYLKNDKASFDRLMLSVPKFILWITLPLTAGIIVLSTNIMFILGGNEFIEASNLIKIVAPIIIFASLSTYLQTQIILPTGNEKIGLYCAILSSVVSIILNILLIPFLSYIGSGIAVLMAEFTAVTSRYFVVKQKLGYKEFNFVSRSSILYLIASVVMIVVVYIIDYILSNPIYGFFVGATSGALVYIFILIIFKESITLETIQKIRSKLGR